MAPTAAPTLAARLLFCEPWLRTQQQEQKTSACEVTRKAQGQRVQRVRSGFLKPKCDL